MSGPFGPARVQGAVEALAGIGVDVRTLPSDAAPSVAITGQPSAIRLLRFQVRNMALELTTGSGTTGAELDRTVVAVGAPKVTPLLVGWLRSAGTSAAALASSVMGSKDLAHPGTVAFPTFVLAAFLADATRGRTGGSAAALAAHPDLLAAGAADFCAQVSSYLSDVLAGVLDPQAHFNVPWLAKVIAQYAPAYVADPGRFRQVVGALALLAYATSVGRAWSVTATPDPQQVDYSIEGQDATEGEVNVSVVPGTQAFSREVQPCAALAQTQLKGKPVKDASLFWDPSGLDGHAKATQADGALDEDGTGSLTYETTAESKEAASSGTPVTAEMTVQVIVDREEMRSLAAVVQGILLGKASGTQAGAAVASLYQKLEPALIGVMFPSAVATIEVRYHTKPSPTPTGGDLSGTWQGAWQSENGAHGAFQLTIDVKGNAISGTWAVTGETCIRHVTYTGTVNGSDVHITGLGETGTGFADGTVGSGGTTISGTYTIPYCGGIPGNDHGTWQATKAK
jgi:hypothetical protein